MRIKYFMDEYTYLYEQLKKQEKMAYTDFITTIKGLFSKESLRVILRQAADNFVDYIYG